MTHEYSRREKARNETVAGFFAKLFCAKLIPYLSAAFARYRRDGLPPFRALVMDFPNDENVRAIDDQ